MKNDLNESEIRRYLKKSDIPKSITVLETVDSTNTYLKSHITHSAQTGTSVIANCQTGGRGRHGKSFFSPADTGIYMSIAIRPESVSDISLITIAACVAVCHALESAADIQPKIKWVNDIFVNGKKSCGILAETAADAQSGHINAIIVGIGINITTQNFPESIKNTAGSICCKNISRNQIAAEIIDNLMYLCDDIKSRKIIDEYRARLMITGKEIHYTINGLARRGTVLDINDHGNLIVQTSDGTRDILKSGEISLGSEHFV